jgi:hypothetical protein
VRVDQRKGHIENGRWVLPEEERAKLVTERAMERARESERCRPQVRRQPELFIQPTRQGIAWRIR